MENQVTPATIMKELVRMHDKLRENGLSDQTLTYTMTPKRVEGQVVYEHVLSHGRTVLASHNQIDPRPIEEIKQAAEEEKTFIQTKTDERKTELDSVITVADSETAK